MSRGGRKKIEMKIIENQRERAVTLSKRHDGAFKKASELATLCGVQIAIILFTISGKPLAFGSPNVVNVVEKFLNFNHGNNESDAIKACIKAFHKAKVEELNKEFDEFNEKSATDKKHSQTLGNDLKVFLGGKTYEDYKSSAGIDKLVQIKCRLEELKRDLQHAGCDAESGPSSSNEEYEVDLSKVQGPRDFLKLW